MNLVNKNVIIFGTGISGISAANLLSEVNAVITLYDSNSKLDRNEIMKRLHKGMDCTVVLGDFPDELYDKAELLIISPGVPTDLLPVERLKKLGVPVWGEVELAYRYEKGKLIAITGTNGKTTTTALTGEIMKTVYPHVFVVGNIGIPYTQLVKETTDESVTVAEMSSFQLESVEEFRPQVSAILNITPDHLNRHHTMEKYIEAKCNITRMQTKDDTCVLNYEDRELRRISRQLNCRIIWFSSRQRLEEGLFVEADHIILRENGVESMVINVHQLNIIGRHNYENAMAAIACAHALNVPLEEIRTALKTFTAVEHRIEFVAMKNGVTYYNDSKGTNPDASIQAVRAMSSRTVLIGGGYDKGSEYDEWIESFGNKIKYLVLMGQTREKIANCARKHGFDNIVFVESMEEAVDFSKAHAEPGECVLLSPCCASWGMFQNYEERGRIFKELVNRLP